MYTLLIVLSTVVAIYVLFTSLHVISTTRDVNAICRDKLTVWQTVASFCFTFWFLSLYWVSCCLSIIWIKFTPLRKRLFGPKLDKTLVSDMVSHCKDDGEDFTRMTLVCDGESWKFKDGKWVNSRGTNDA